MLERPDLVIAAVQQVVQAVHTGSQLCRNNNFPQRRTTVKENQVVLKRQKYSTWFKLDDVRPLAFFVILACLLGWMPYIVSALGAADIAAVLGDNGSLANWPFGPLVAAAIVSAFLGRAGLKNWWRRLTTFRAAPGWYILAFVAPVVIVSAAVLANSALGAPLPTASQLSKWTDLPGLFVVYLIVVDRKSKGLNSSHTVMSYAVFCL